MPAISTASADLSMSVGNRRLNTEVFAAVVHGLAHAVFLFPYLRLAPIGHPAGVQWQVVALSAGVILFHGLRGRLFLNSLLIPLLAVPVIALIWPSQWADTTRSLAIYLTMYGALIYFRGAIRSGFPTLAVLKIALAAALVGGLAQALLGSSILDPIVHSRTSEARGVTSLFVEPSFYGIWVAMLTLVICVFDRDRLQRRTWFLIAFVQVVVLSQSSIAIIFAALCLIVYLGMVRGRLLLLGLIAVAPFSLWVVSGVLVEGSRASQIVLGLLTDPLSILLSDVSVGLRISHVVLPLWGSFSSSLLPHGFSQFETFQLSVENQWPFLLEPGDRIMSGYGSAFFELGFFTFAILAANFSYLRGTRRPADGPGRLAMTAIAIALLVMYVNAISFALPVFPLVVAILTTEPPTRARRGASRPVSGSTLTAASG